jgi:hypothetical protein
MLSRHIQSGERYTKKSKTKFWHVGQAHECQKKPNLHKNELNTFFSVQRAP